MVIWVHGFYVVNKFYYFIFEKINFHEQKLIFDNKSLIWFVQV